MLDVARRHGKPVLLSIDAKQMLADGHDFFVTGNNVSLTERVPPDYIEVASLASSRTRPDTSDQS